MSPESSAARATSAVIPAAGFATRFLPATKTVPKELLPIVDRPVLQYIVEEAVHAGIDDVLLITGRGKTSMVDYFDRRPELEAALAAKGDQARLEAVRAPAELVELYTVRQPEMLGLGHAVGCAAHHIGDAPFAVLLPDEFTDPGEPLLPRMLDLQARTGGIVLAFVEVPDDQVSRYGIGSVEPADPALGDPETTVTVTGLVEKPSPEEAPSNLAVIGRYVLPGSIFDAIRRTKPGAGGEIQLTDAMALLLAEGTPVHGVIHRGARYDTGVPLGYLEAVVRLACQRDDIGPRFRQWLASFVREELATESTPGRDSTA
ncbi:MAG TPA: UTP--glucose-1-phosphate uridylyltransferase [Natronosporangium sp.]|nr:UTP--glucose-1-phosphate uridylyltransferase [Natronosporangium sp.]